MRCHVAMRSTGRSSQSLTRRAQGQQTQVRAVKEKQGFEAAIGVAKRLADR